MESAVIVRRKIPTRMSFLRIFARSNGENSPNKLLCRLRISDLTENPFIAIAITLHRQADVTRHRI